VPSSPSPLKLCLPKAGSHRDRKRLRIKPGGVPKVDKQYVIDKIIKHRREAGTIEYFVHWLGYGVADRTWEPSCVLEEDAPAVVREYKESCRDFKK